MTRKVVKNHFLHNWVSVHIVDVYVKMYTASGSDSHIIQKVQSEKLSVFFIADN